MARVLITGAAGFVGSHLAQQCLDSGHQVVGIDCFTSYYEPQIKRNNLSDVELHPNWTFVEGDLLGLDLDSLLSEAEVVFHLAAQPGVRASWGQTFDAYVENNVTAMQRLLESAKRAALHRFVFASSSSVYGNAETLPTSEHTVLHPVSPYGATKALGEHLCHVYHQCYQLPVVALRYFTVYGPRQRPDMAFNKLISAALEDREIVIYGDGEQTRDFTYVADAADATLAAATFGVPGRVYNIGGGSRTSMNEVLTMIAEISGRDLNVRREDAQRGDARDTAADTTLARQDLGFAPSRSLREGLSDQVAWHEAMRAAPSGTLS